MNMKVDFFDNSISISNEFVNVIEIENKKYFYRFINALNDIAINGFSDEILFFDNTEKNMNGKVKLIIDYFNFGFDAKGYDKEINKLVNNLINEEEKNNLISQYNKIKKIYNRILNNIDLPLSIENDINIENITKMIKIGIKSSNELLDNLFLLIDLEKILKTNCIIFFVNLKQYLNDNELIELYKYSIYNQVNIILVDSQAYGCTIEYEKKLIIDQNLDEFMI